MDFKPGFLLSQWMVAEEFYAKILSMASKNLGTSMGLVM
jgi:hypothetical protein